MFIRRRSFPPAECPTCASWNKILLAIVTRERPDQPWKHDPIGSCVRCARCGSVYNLILGHRPELVMPPQSPSAPGPAPSPPGPGPQSDMADVLGPLAGRGV